MDDCACTYTLWDAVSSLYAHSTQETRPIAHIPRKSHRLANTTGEVSQMNCMWVSCHEFSVAKLDKNLLEKVMLEFQEKIRGYQVGCLVVFFVIRISINVSIIRKIIA